MRSLERTLLLTGLTGEGAVCLRGLGSARLGLDRLCSRCRAAGERHCRPHRGEQENPRDRDEERSPTCLTSLFHGPPSVRCPPVVNHAISPARQIRCRSGKMRTWPSSRATPTSHPRRSRRRTALAPSQPRNLGRPRAEPALLQRLPRRAAADGAGAPRRRRGRADALLRAAEHGRARASRPPTRRHVATSTGCGSSPSRPAPGVYARLDLEPGVLDGAPRDVGDDERRLQPADARVARAACTTTRRC